MEWPPQVADAPSWGPKWAVQRVIKDDLCACVVLASAGSLALAIPLGEMKRPIRGTETCGSGVTGARQTNIIKKKKA